MIRLLSTDFDGTLVDHYARPPVHPDLMELFAALQAKGVRWAVNTGRDLPLALEGLEQFGFSIMPDYLLTAEREVFHRVDGKWVAYGGWNQACYNDHDELFNRSGALLEDIERFLRTQVRAEPIWEGKRMVGLAATTERDMELTCRFLERERRRVPGFAFMRNTLYVRFCHEAYNKGTALSELARLLGIGANQVFAAGDHYNDLPMLDGVHARWVCCPANAVTIVKQAVTAAGGHVARGMCSEGVVEGLRKFMDQVAVG
jgi:HAD superfamily hydrolase (TIGR01484 family)